MEINKSNIVFFDTNILSDIGRFSKEKIREINFQLSVDMKLLIAITPFNILEIEKIPDETVKANIHYFLNLANVIFFKGMDILFADEITSFCTGNTVNPIQFITTLISETKDGKPFNYQSILDNLLSDPDYQKTFEEHLLILNKQQEHFQNKLSLSEQDFGKILFKEHLMKLYPDLHGCDWNKIADRCPSYMSYAYSLYDKIGSKGLRKKAGEMNDTAMSYIFPYVGIIVTEKRQTSVFNKVKSNGYIPALKDTIILKHSDVFVKQDFKLNQTVLNIQII